jgi:PII-like signaling protein
MISVVEKPEKQNDLVRVVTEMMQDGIIVTSDVELRQIVEAIVNRCRELNVAGATVFHAREGFGETAELHHRHLFESDLPIVITIVESPEKAAGNDCFARKQGCQ